MTEDISPIHSFKQTPYHARGINQVPAGAAQFLGVILFRKRKSDVFRMFVNDIIIDAGFEIISLLPEDVEKICEVSAKFNLDFDDAYQYTAGKEYNLSIVSFDCDFDGTDRGRKKPSELFE